MTKKEYKSFIKKLPRGTVAAVAKDRGVEPPTIYTLIERGNVEVLAQVIAMKKKIDKQNELKESKLKQLIESA